LKHLEKIISENMVRLRKAKGYHTQEAAAEAAGIPFRTYQDIERGVTWPRRSSLKAIAQALGVGEAQLFIDPAVSGKITPQEALDVISEALQAVSDVDPLSARIARLSPKQRRHLEHALEAIEESEDDEEKQTARKS
jgi:transcriptional regulator with XRE-family HTH domain